MGNKPNKPHHSPEILTLAAKTLSNPRASDLSKSLSASILGGAGHEERPTKAKQKQG